MIIKPLKDKLYIEPVEEPKTTPSGIYLPPDPSERSNKARVLAVGEDVDIAIGSIILYNAYKQSDFTVRGEKIYIINKEDVFATVGE